jgi:hypothetical protein
MLRDVIALAGEIGPRGTGTEAERRAADYVAGRLEALGLPVERRRFRAVAGQNAFPLAVSLLALTALAVYPLGGLGRWVAALLGPSSAPLLLGAIRSRPNPLRPLLAQVESENVETMARAAEYVMALLEVLERGKEAG